MPSTYTPPVTTDPTDAVRRAYEAGKDFVGEQGSWEIIEITSTTLTVEDAVETGPATGEFMVGPALVVLFAHRLDLRIDFTDRVGSPLRYSYVLAPAGLELFGIIEKRAHKKEEHHEHPRDDSP